jgi:outer membrane lipoprotein
MPRRSLLALMLVTPALAVLSCGQPIAPIPGPLLRQVDWTVTDAVLMNAPERYIGRTVVLGGAVLKTVYFPDRAVLEVLHLPLNRSTRPISVLRDSQGLFIAMDSPTSPAARVAPGAVITVVGEVVKPERPGGSTVTGSAPHVHVKHLHVWESSSTEEERLSGFQSVARGEGVD